MDSSAVDHENSRVVDITDNSVVDIGRCIFPPPGVVNKAFIDGGKYQQLYRQSIENPIFFWDKIAKEFIEWFIPYDRVTNVDFEQEFSIPSDGDIAWFLNGKLNACYNAVDRHVVAGKGNNVAIIYEANEVGFSEKITYKQLLDNVCELAGALKALNICRGDFVSIYMPMIPEAIYCVLACARIGAVANVIFAGFSSVALATRVRDAGSVCLITSNVAFRGEKKINLKSIVSQALQDCPSIKSLVMLMTAPNNDFLEIQRELSNVNIACYEYRELTNRYRHCYTPCIWVDSEDFLFVLYTSGSTGKPKGIVHTTGGFLVYASFTHKYIFDVHEDDVYACVADIGWITGHSYVIWAPLLNGGTTLVFGSTPLYPAPDRYWDLIETHKVTIFYTTPTALRLLMKYGDELVNKYDLTSLRILGSVGEVIDPSTWEWYYRVVGKENVAIVDTYWMTESGGIVMSPLPSCTTVKPGSCCQPFFGISPVILDPISVKKLEKKAARGVICFDRPWPGMARTIYLNHELFVQNYLKPYPGYFFTGDGAYRDEDGYYWITGRVDDVVNVCGHRLGTAELEAAFVMHPACLESAVVGIQHEIKGQIIHAFCVLNQGFEASSQLYKELISTIRNMIGGIAVPEKIYFVPSLPKTRSGKVMRRILRKIASNQVDSLGDISTIAEPEVLQNIIDTVKHPKL